MTVPHRVISGRPIPRLSASKIAAPDVFEWHRGKEQVPLARVSSKRTKVSLVVPNLASGGSERMMALLSERLSAKRFDVSLVVLSVDETNDKHIKVDNPIDLGVERIRFALPKILKYVWAERPEVMITTLPHLNILVGALPPFVSQTPMPHRS